MRIKILSEQWVKGADFEFKDLKCCDLLYSKILTQDNFGAEL